MPAAKYCQLVTTGEAAGNYTGVNYLEANYAHMSRNDRWELNKERPGMHYSEAAYRPNQDVRKWIQPELSPEWHNQVMYQDSEQHMRAPTEYHYREGRSYSENNCIAAENGNPAIPYVIHSQSNGREPAASSFTSPSEYGLSPNQMYESYQLCSSFRIPSNCAPQNYCSETMPLEADFTRRAATDSDVFLPPSVNNRVCTEQPQSSVEGMSQGDFAIEHCRQTKARQLPYFGQDYEQYPSHFADQSNPALLGSTRANSVEHYQVNNGVTTTPSEFNRCDDARRTQPSQTTRQQQYSHECNSDLNETSYSYPNQRNSPRERMLCSVSSDPEIYTKTPSVAKLNAQIQRLREEMLTLRSTTLSYKQHMETLFNDLKIITRTNDSGRLPWMAYEDPHLAVNDPSVGFDCVANHLTTQNRSSGKSMSTAATSKRPTNTFSKNVSDKDQPPSIHRELPSYENVMDMRLRPQGSNSHSESDNNAAKRSKGVERPNSDPFSLCPKSNGMMFASTTEEPIDAMSLPHSQSDNKYVAKSAASSLESGVRKTKVNKDSLRILPVLSNSNAALHISECSIDSGYQGSSVTSPRDRQGRELTSQVVTPASPISESPVDVTNNNQKKIGNDCHVITEDVLSSPPTSNDSLQKQSVCTSIVTQTSKINGNETTNAGVPNIFLEKDEDGISIQNEATAQPPKIVKLKLYDGPSSVFENNCINNSESNDSSMTNLNRSSTTSNGSDDLRKSDRPVPKQRTLFGKSSQSVCSAKQINLPDLCKAEETTQISNKDDNPMHVKMSNTTKTVYSQQSGKVTPDFDDNEHLNSPHSKAEAPRPTPPKCLTFVKQDQKATSGDTGSPVQSRVKLGVSSIKQLTPNTDKKEGSIFYCTGQVSKPNDVASRLRKTANAKQLLREKYAAVVEKSSSAENKVTGLIDEDGESSMVRRRSMRMMTEFQIFDFKDSSKNLNSRKVRAKPMNNTSNQIKSNPKYVSASVSNRLIKSAPNSSYSVSPSAAAVCKDVFAVEKTAPKISPQNNSAASKSSSLRKIKQEESKPITPEEPYRNYENVTYSYEGEPLPPPPPTPPRSPPVVNGNPPSLSNSQVSLFSEVELATRKEKRKLDGAFFAPLVRPKASLPGVSCDVGPPEVPKGSYNGLKLRSNTKSAFTPVLSTSSHSLASKASISDLRDLSTKEEDATTEFKRRASLPSSMVSNKQRFLNEFMPSSSHNDARTQCSQSSERDCKPNVHRQSSLRSTRNNTKAVEPLKSDGKSSEMSKGVAEKPTSGQPVWRKQTFATTEPLFSEMPKKGSDEEQKKEKRKRTASDKTKVSTPSNEQYDLESQPIRFARSDKMTDVVGVLRSAGYLPNNGSNSSNADTKPKVSASNISTVLGLNETKEAASCRLLPSSGNSRPKDLAIHRPTHKKSHSSSALHQYEVIQPLGSDKAKFISKAHGSKQAVRQGNTNAILTPEEGASERAPMPSRSQKSTMALIKASLLGKRDKGSRSATAEGKRDAPSNKSQKSRSSSAGAKSKITDYSPVVESKASSTVSKDTKSKKNKNSSKQSKTKESKTSKEHKAGEIRNSKQRTADVFPPSPALPDAGYRGYGDPDSEVMERFLAATAAAASQAPRSPLQRLRSSLRVPKNKTKLMNASRVKDDMDVERSRDPMLLASHFDKNYPHGQEFTYV